MVALRVLLCQSYLGPQASEPRIFPLGLAYLASSIQADHEVLCWDPNVAQNPKHELLSLLERFDPDIVGVSLRNIDNAFSFHKRSYYPPFVSMVRTIRAAKPDCKLVVGGSGFTLFAHEILTRNPEIDFGIVSEGEQSLAALLADMNHPPRIRNLAFRKNGRIIFTEKAYVDFSSLPVPARDIVKLEKYRAVPYSMGVQSKRGCAFNCAFCSVKYLVGHDYRLRSPRAVVDEIEELVDKYGLRSFFFVDPTFNSPFDHSRKICHEITRRKLNVDWAAEFRPETMNASFMKEAVKSGCSLFSFSADGASDRAMQKLGKNLTVRDIERTIHLVSRTDNAKVGYSFLYDLPYCNREHTLGLLRLVPKIMMHCEPKVQFVCLTRIRIYPHTSFYETVLSQGKIHPNTELLYPIHYVSGSPMSMGSLLPYFLRGSSVLFDRLIKSCWSS